MQRVIQFDTLFTDGLYEAICGEAVKKAMTLREAFLAKGISMYGSSMTNQQFPILTDAQKEALAKNFADPEAVYWDVSHNNALYVFPDPDPEWCVIMPLSMPSGDTRAMKKIGKYDGVATAYREKRWEIKRRGMAEIKLSRKDRN